MSEGRAPEGAPAAAGTGRRRWIPFWVLQLAELVVAFVLVDVSVHVSNSGVMVAAAVAFTGLAVTAHGPLGIIRVCRPWLHLTLLIALAALVALSPVVPALRPDIEGIIVLEFAAVGLIRLATLTDMQPSPRSRRTASRRNDRMVIDATATVARQTTARAAAGDPGGTTPPSTTGTAARWAGRAAGVASASGRRAVARHRPEAEAQVKRAIRGAGRFTGKATSPHRDRPGEPTPGDPDGG